MRLLIADDDDYTREGLSESFDWDKYGIDEIYLAADGAEALRIATAKKPEIVLTDIRMPKLNGIEFAKRLAEKSPDSQLLFMSGYMDVEYLKSAIKLSAVEYIEKPIKLSEVERAIDKSIRSLANKQQQTAVVKQKNELVRQKLAGMLRDEHVDKAETVRLCRESYFPADQRYWGIMIWNRLEAGDGYADLQLMLQYWQDNGMQAIGDQLDRRHCFLVLASDRHDARKLSSLCDLFLKRYEAYSISIGTAANHLHELPNAYKTAMRAMEQAFYSADRRVFHYIEADRMPEDHSHEKVLPEFYRVRMQSPEQMLDFIRSICAQFRMKQSPAKERVVTIFETIIQGTTGHDQKQLAALDSEYGIPDVEHYLRECRTLDGMEQLMLAVCSVWIEQTQQVAQYSRLVQEVLKYIAANYRNVDLDLRMIAEHMHLSTAHLGLLFKQETGTTIKQYISDYRMDVAKKLVAGEHLKMNTIAELCGYASASYFAKVFKASTDLSPIEYRRKS
ncbi:hypothetical protein PCCS19_22710 [Paenibacillus sp. CCS19]|uniref:response regulator n=1 Tax=Paenibacillus sp. CCS19 TaxID=3158387 RepID=UPI0025649D16|nr:response regulator [Paenibacillus cellulosilyticus]GMK39217.1 hypothetical protein PCCS19_22710 [Paenibacillus cellulosilyticus]